MGPSKEFCLYLLCGSLIPFIKCGVLNEVKCKDVWVDNRPQDNVLFSIYENSSINNAIYMVNWQWETDLSEKWILYYKEWPKKGIHSGGFVLSDKHRTPLAKLSWKLNNGLLLWTMKHRKSFIASWNATVCKIKLPLRLQSTRKGWIFYLDDILLTGGKSGKKNLNAPLLTLVTKEERKPYDRTKREAEDMEGKEKQSVWNKIKGWFKELFDQGENDSRGWLTRLGDWVLGFLERVLT